MAADNLERIAAQRAQARAADDFDSLSDSAIIRLPALCKILGGISAATAWRLRDRGLRPVKVTPGATGWRVGDVRAYLAARGTTPAESGRARKAAQRSLEARRLRGAAVEFERQAPEAHVAAGASS